MTVIPRAVFVACAVLLLTACAASSPSDSGPERSEPERRDLGMPGAFDADTGGSTGGDDAGTDDTDGPAVLDVSFDSGGGGDDTGAADTGTTDTTTADTGPCTGIGCACTVSTRAAVCGRLACVDGVCCESSCSGDCRSCAVPGSEGTCTFAPAGEDPDDDCGAQAESTCGRDGTCDGAGECRLYGAGSSCDDGEACSEGDSCDGNGTCRGEVPGTCGPGAGNECCVGTCADGAGCGTAAAACADVCGSTELTVGRACAGCGAAGAAGVCAGGGTHRCTAVDHSECQELTCGGVRYFCTNSGGTWGWRPTGTCNDGDACTYNDRCGGGECIGTRVSCTDTVCADRECNGTASCTVTPNTGVGCDDGDACTYDDRCSSAGVCVGGGTTTCVDGPCIARDCTGGPTCRETILTGSGCDDGNACTYGDTCSSGGSCTGGGTVSCSGLDTTCMHYACDGSSVCRATPRNVGGVCDDGNAETDFDTCSAAGSCVGDVGCPPPSEACVYGSQDRRGCSGARVISRLDAGTGWSLIDDTCSARDSFDDSSGCWDANRDHSYRLYMREGEQVTVRYITGEACDGTWGWGGTLKIFETGGCGDRTCGAKVYCDYLESDQTKVYTAVRDGWIVIVADGSHASDDSGAYQLNVSLNCRSGNCGCL